MTQENESNIHNKEKSKRPLPLVILGCAISLFLPGGGHILLGYFSSGIKFLIAMGIAMGIAFSAGKIFSITSQTSGMVVMLPAFFIWIAALKHLWSAGTGTLPIDESDHDTLDLTKPLTSSQDYGTQKIEVDASASKFDSVEAVIETFQSQIKDQSIYFAPAIPEKMLNNSLKSYARSGENEKILVLYDQSLLKSAKIGALVTDSAIYVSGITGSPQSIKLKEIKTIKREILKMIFINGKEFLNMGYAKKESTELFVEMLKALSATLNASRDTELYMETDLESKDQECAPVAPSMDSSADGKIARLARATGAEQIDLTVELLRDPSQEIKSDVISLVVRLKINALGVLFELVNILADEDDSVSLEAAKALWNLDSVEYAIRSLQDEHENPANMSKESALRGIKSLMKAASEKTEFDNLLKEKWQNCPLLTSSKTEHPEMPEFNEATVIRRFKGNQKQQFQNHLKIIKKLIEDKFYPLLNVYTLESIDDLEFSYLIIITGGKEQFLLERESPEINKKMEEVIKNHFNGDFSSVTPHSSVKDTPGKNENVDRSFFDNFKSLIEDGRYKLLEKIFKNDQNRNLVKSYKKSHNEVKFFIDTFGDKLIQCRQLGCERKFPFKDAKDIRFWSDSKELIYFLCPICQDDTYLSCIGVKDLEELE